MKKPTQNRPFAVTLAALLAAQAAFTISSQAQVTFQQVTNGLVDYYPLNSINSDGVTTPDYISRRDMILSPGMGAGNVVAASHPGMGDGVNCFDLNQSGSPTVIYYNTTGQNPLDGSGDFLPFCNQRGATMNFWIKANGLTTGSDKRFFGEADTTGSSGDPLFLIGTSSGTADTSAHFLIRDSANSGSLILMQDGTYESPAPGYYWTQGNNFTSAGNPVLDGNWHMFTVAIDTNGNAYTFIDGVYDPGSQNGGPFTDTFGNPTIGSPLPLTNWYYTTNVYPSAGVSNPPPNGFVRWMQNAIYSSGSTAFGGFKRGGISGGAVCQVNDIGFWNRVLDTNEMVFVMTNGLPGLALNTNSIFINNFFADFGEIGQGNTVNLTWNVTGASATPGGIIISGVGDVSAIPTGTTNITLSANKTYTFTLTAHNGVVADKTASVSVKTFPGVPSDWHLIQRFDGLFGNTTAGINGNGWVSLLSDYTATPRDRWNVVTLNTGGETEKVLSAKSGYDPDINSPLGFDTRGALAYGVLNNLTMPPAQASTLFFRFSLQDPGTFATSLGIFSGLDFGAGITDFNFNTPLSGSGTPGTGGGASGGVGPTIRIVRADPNYTAMPFDLQAQDYSGSAYTNSYSYVSSADANGLATNVNYFVWLDVQNLDTHAEINGDGTTNTANEAVFSIWLQKQGDTSRTLLVSDFHGDRDYVNYQQAIDSPKPYLDRVFFSIADESFLNGTLGGAFFETNNMIAVDDVYLSKGGFNSTIPRLFDLTSVVRGTGSVTINWNSLGSIFQTNTYTIQRKLQVTDGSWTTLTTGYPSGGDTTSYTDNTIGASDSAFYRITWP